MRYLFATLTLMSQLILSTGAMAQSINGVPIGSTVPSTGKFTNLEATTSIKLGADTVTKLNQVKVSDTDTSDFLGAQIVSGSGINVDSSDGNNVVISATGAGILSNKGDLLTHDGNGEVSLGVGAPGQVLTPDSTGGLEWANGERLFNSNALLNTYRHTNTITNVSPLKIIDGVVDGFALATGIDGAASANALFDPNDGQFYSPTSGAGITIPMVKFDGENDYLSINDNELEQNDGKSFTVSFWLNLDPASDGVLTVFLTAEANGFIIQKDPDGKIRVYAENEASNIILNIVSTNVVNSSSGPTHIGVAVNTDTGIQITINGILDTDTSLAGVGDIDFQAGAVYVGSYFGSLFFLAGDLGQFYLAEEYIDISDPAKLDLFYDNGNPVDMGPGNWPDNIEPRIFLNNARANWHINLGSGGDFTVNGGGLSDGIPSSISTSGGTDNMTLVSNSQTAKTSPNAANILLLAEDIDPITPNTDLKASVSRDGGTTFSQVTLSDVGEFEKGKLLTGTVDLSSQPSGTDMEWKVETDNNIDVNLHGVGLEWR